MQTGYQKIIRWVDGAPPWRLAALLGALAFLLYANTLQHGYVLDDMIVITENAKVKDGLVDLGAYFEQSRSQLLEDQYGYRPLTLISLALDIELLGPGAAHGHWMNVLYYVLVVVLLFFTLRRLFPGGRQLLPFLVTLLFVVHPIHVEAVANIKSRDEILALLFGLAALQMFLRWVRSFDRWYYFPAAVVLVGAAYLSKENGMTFLAVLPLAALVQTGLPPRRKAVAALSVPAAAGLLVLGLALWSQGQTVDQMELTAGQGIFMEDQIMGNAMFVPHETHERIATGTGILGRYWKTFLVPYPLVYYSGYNQVPLTGFADPWVIASLLFHLLLLGLSVWGFRRHPILCFGIGYYFVTISIYSHFLRPLSDAMADRFLLSPSVGMALVVVYGLMLLGKMPRKSSETLPAPSLRQLSAGLIFLLLTAAFSVLTFQRNQVWADNLTLFSNDIPHLEDCARCHYHYAEALAQSDPQALTQPGLQREIIHHYRRAIEITDRSYNAYITLGRIYYSLGKMPQGNQIFEEAVAKYPGEARPWFELGFGKFNQQRFREAIPALEKATELAPNREDNYFYLAWSYYKSGDPARALSLMEDLHQKSPQQVVFNESLAEMYIETGQSQRAQPFVREALDLSPGNLDLYKKFATLYLLTGDTLRANEMETEARGLGLIR